jgi:hypothetical protein
VTAVIGLLPIKDITEVKIMLSDAASIAHGHSGLGESAQAARIANRAV